jgi:hypothetical protein
MSHLPPKRVHSAASLVGLTAAISLIPSPADAYLDAASGSMIIQALITGVVGGLFIFRNHWRRLKSVFSSRRSLKQVDGRTDEP